MENVFVIIIQNVSFQVRTIFTHYPIIIIIIMSIYGTQFESIVSAKTIRYTKRKKKSINKKGKSEYGEFVHWKCNKNSKRKVINVSHNGNHHHLIIIIINLSSI